MSTKSVSFKVGDSVVGLQNNYRITKKGWKGVVTEIGDEDILVHSVKDMNTFWVDSRFFRKARKGEIKVVPTFTNFLDWKVRILKDNYVFECGAVKLTRSQILKYRKFLEMKNDKDIITVLKSIEEHSSKSPTIKEVTKLLNVKTKR